MRDGRRNLRWLDIQSRAIVTVHGKEQFLKQLEAIVESVRQNRMKIERRQQEEKSKRDSLNIQLSELVDKARQYAKVLRDFQEVFGRAACVVSICIGSLSSRSYEKTNSWHLN